MARTGNRGTWTGADRFEDAWEASSDNFASPPDVIATTLNLPDAVEQANAGRKVRLRVTGFNTYGSSIAYSAPVTIPAISLPALVITPAATQFQAGTPATAAGAVIATISGAYPGATVSLPGNETRFVLNTAKDKLLVGAAPLTAAGSITLQVFQTLAGAANSPQANTVNVVVTAGVSGAPANPLDSLTGARLIFGGTKQVSAFSGAPVATGTNSLTLADQSGVAQDVVVGSGSTAPVLRAAAAGNGFNGRPFIEFGGTGQGLTTAAPITVSSGSFILVMTMRRPSSQPQEWGSPVTLWSTTPMPDGNYQYVRPYFRPPSAGNNMHASSWFTETNQLAAPIDTAFVFGIKVVNGKMVFRVNDTTSTETDVSPAMTANMNLWLGRSPFPGGGSGFPFECAVATSDGWVGDDVGDWDLLFAQYGKFLGLKTQTDVDNAWTARTATGTAEPSAPVSPPPPIVTQPSTAYDTFSRVYVPSTKVKPTLPTTPVAGVVFAPSLPQPSGGNDLQAFGFTGPAGVTIPQRMMTFATTFAPGQVTATQAIDVFYGGTAKEAQMVVLTKHPDDNSVDHALIITTQPAIVNGALTTAMIRKTATALTGSDVGTSFFPGSTITGSITYKRRKGYGPSGAETGVNVSYGMSPSQLLANATATSTRYVGKLASERRYTYNCGHALAINVDITSFKDGTEAYEFEVMAYRNRVSGVQDIGSYFVDIAIAQGGTPVASQTDLRLYNATGWGKLLHTGLTAATNASNNPADTTIVFDAPELVRQGVIAPVDFSNGVNDSLLAGYATAASTSRLPGDFAGMELADMGKQGGRPDLGIHTTEQQVYFLTMDPRARQRVIAQAEAARTSVANWFDGINNVPMTPFPDVGGQPGLWLDIYGGGDRARNDGVNPANTFSYDNSCGRNWDGAHQPSMSYAGYLVTGRRMLGEALEREGTFNLAAMWYAQRWKTISGDTHDWCFMQGNQVREAGWTACRIGQAVRLVPDSSAIKVPLRRAMNWNFAYMLTQVPAWKAQQGDPFGFLPGASPYGNTENAPYWSLKPWQDDHVVAGVWMCAMAGSQNAKTFMDQFTSNFAVQRCMHEDVLPINKAADYVFAVSSLQDLNNPPFTEKTWAAFAARGVIKPGDGFWVGGNYGRLQMRSNVLIASLSNSADARTVCQKHRDHANDQGPYFTLGDRRADPLDWFREIAWS